MHFRGCSICLKEFRTEHFGLKPNYSRYNIQLWSKRDHNTPTKTTLAAYSARTATERKMIEKSYGCRYSKLLELLAFNLVRQHIVDPMHNLFLGIAKHTVKQWKESAVISYETLKDKDDSMIVSSNIGRIPRKISSCFMSFTADEWKNWTVIYSIYALHGILPSSHYQCWCLFVKACRVLLQARLTGIEVKLVQNYLLQSL